MFLLDRVSRLFSSDGRWGATYGPRLFRVVLTLCAGLIVCAGWYFQDRLQSYRVGYPSPQTYLALSSARFVDSSSTKEVRDQAESRIVAVRVRDDDAYQTVASRIAALEQSRDLGFASDELINVVMSLPDETREAVIEAAIKIAKSSSGDAATPAVQTALIWEALSAMDMPQSDKNIVFQLADSMMMPTVHDDAEMTARIRQEISAQIPSAVRQIDLGSIIVKQGETVTQHIADILREQGYPDADKPWKDLGFIVILTFAWCIWITSYRTKHDEKLTDREWIFASLVLIIDWVIQRCFARWGVDSRGMDALSILAVTGWLFLMLPKAFAFQVSLGGCVIGYFLSFSGMTSQIAVGCVISGIACGAANVWMRDASSRLMIWKGIFSLGILVAFSALTVRWGLGLEISWIMLRDFLFLCAIWSTVVISVLPLWEWAFGMISPLRLLEMSHPSEPLLKRLQIEAPGTYQHSVVVATLAEGVVDKLEDANVNIKKMNALLVRTGAYYHDIGKLKRPNYFIENQAYGDNIHDRLAPAESAKRILGHVEDGLAIADESRYHLPEAIKDFIRQHHGKDLHDYFYEKAIAEDKEAGGDGSNIDRAAFCYPGPDPQTPEIALLMMADSIEAAIRNLQAKSVKSMPTKEDYEKLVSEVIDKKVSKGLLSDVEFTYREITAIKSAFVKVLVSMYHTRDIPTARDEEERDELPHLPVSPHADEISAREVAAKRSAEDGA